MIALSRYRLLRELERWHSDGHRPLLWWRDDDAREISPALERLLTIANGLPVSIAVIPDGASPTLADWLAGIQAVTIAQHGIDHVNKRQPAEGSSADYSSAIAPVPLAREILAGRDRLERVGLEPVFFTPPWNRVEPVLLEALPIAGYFALSGWNDEGGEKPGIQRLDTHIDLLRWKGGARFRGADRVYDELRRQLADRRYGGDFTRPIGLLTHHLVHDSASWKFLEVFVELLRPAVEFCGFSQLAVD